MSADRNLKEVLLDGLYFFSEIKIKTSSAKVKEKNGRDRRLRKES